ncbi:MAG: hypothetical protein ABIL58_19405 [Pseudomonadota bacterium]
MAEDTQTIAIDGALYRELRGYCDTNGIRLVDFIEDSLETAIYRSEMEKLLADAERLKERVEFIKREAIRQGFTQGVLAASLALGGHLDLSEQATPEAAKSEIDFRAITGGQLPLFGGPQEGGR